jgi:hypothetical protein
MQVLLSALDHAQIYARKTDNESSKRKRYKQDISYAELKSTFAYSVIRDTGLCAILIFLPLTPLLDTGKFAPFLVRNSG